MLFPVHEKYKISSEFWQSRPLSLPYEKRTHPHAAWDIACSTGTPIVAPENGVVAYLLAVRADRDRELSEIPLSPQPFRLRGHHYFYDTYGGIVILLGESNLTHIFTHSFANQLYNHAPVDVKWTYTESRDQERWPVMAWHTFEDVVRVRAGQIIGAVGNAGYSTGPHIHYEIHRGREYREPMARVDPKEIFPDEWNSHQLDDRGYNWQEEMRRWR